MLVCKTDSAFLSNMLAFPLLEICIFLPEGGSGLGRMVPHLWLVALARGHDYSLSLCCVFRHRHPFQFLAFAHICFFTN